MAITREGGKLFEESEETLRQRLEAMGLEESAVTNQALAQSLGASKDSTKMIGTQAQKTPVLQAQVAKESTLAGAQRLDQGRMSATDSEQASILKAQQMAQLGSLSTRVQGLIETKIGQATQAPLGQAQVQQAALATQLGSTPEQLTRDLQDPETKASKVQAQLIALSNNPTGPMAEQALKELANLGITETQAATMIDTGKAATGKAVATQLQDTVKLGELDFTQMGFGSQAEVAEMLGVAPEALAEMTLPEFQEQVSKAQMDQFDSAMALKAQIAALPPGAQRSTLVAQLKDMGQVGVTLAERKVAQTVEEIDRADKVKLGGEEYQVDELLKDDKISSLIQEYIYATPERQQELLPSEKFGDLRDWINSNQLALADLSSDLASTSEAFRETQEAWANLGNLNGNISLDPAVLTSLGIGYEAGQVVTSAEVTAMNQALLDSNVGKAITGTDATANRRIAGKLTEENAAVLKDLSPTAIQDADKYGELSMDETLRQLAGIPEGADFVTDPAMQDALDTAIIIRDTLKKDDNLKWLTDPDFQGLTVTQRESLAKNPSRFDEFKRFQDIQRDITNMGPNPSMEEILHTMMGLPDDSAVNMDSLTENYNQIQLYAKLGDPAAIKMRDQWKAMLDPDGNGKLEESDAQTLLKRLQDSVAGVNVDTVIADATTLDTETGALRQQIDKLFGDMKGLVDAKVESTGYIPTEGTLFSKVGSFLKGDNEVTEDEFSALSLDERRQFVNKMTEGLGGPDLKKKFDNIWYNLERQEAMDMIGSKNSGPNAVLGDRSLSLVEGAMKFSDIGSRRRYARENPIDPKALDEQIAAAEAMEKEFESLANDPANSYKVKQDQLNYARQKWMNKKAHLRAYKEWQNYAPPATVSTKDQQTITGLFGGV